MKRASPMAKVLSATLSLSLIVAADLQAAQVLRQPPRSAARGVSPQGAVGIVQDFFDPGAGLGFDELAPVFSLLSSHAPGDPAIAPIAREFQAASRAYLEDRASPELLAQVRAWSLDAAGAADPALRGGLAKSEALALLTHPLVLDLLDRNQAHVLTQDYRAYREALAENRRAGLGSKLGAQARALQRAAGAALAVEGDAPSLPSLPERASQLRPASGARASFEPAGAMAMAAAAMPLAQDGAFPVELAVLLAAGAASLAFLGALLIGLIRRVDATLDAVPSEREIMSFNEAESLILDYERTGADGMSSRHPRSRAMERAMGQQAFERMLAQAYATSREFKAKYPAFLHPRIARMLLIFRGG